MENPFTTIDVRLSKIESMLSRLVVQEQHQIKQQQVINLDTKLKENPFSGKKEYGELLIGISTMGALEKLQHDPENSSIGYSLFIIAAASSLISDGILKNDKIISVIEKASKEKQLTREEFDKRFVPKLSLIDLP